MPLSEHEERVLAELERAFRHEDPKFANSFHPNTLTVTPTREPRPIGRYLAAAAGVLVGLGVLVLGAVLEHLWLGVGGFAVMFAIATWAVMAKPPARSAQSQPNDSRVHEPAGSTSRATFMNRMEDRWDRRRDPRA